MYSNNSNSSNPFFVDNEMDEEFLRGSRRQPGGGAASYSNTEERRRHLLAQIEASESRQLESTQRALASIYDSEKMAITTAEELLVQGDQLDNIERRTDEITTMSNSAQKHINSIKSVFGGIRNYFSRGGDKPASTDAATQPSLRQSQLKETVSRVERERPQNPSVDYSGLRDDSAAPTDLDSKFLAGSRRPDVQRSEYIRRVTNSQQEAKMEQNLDMMAGGLSRLKGLAMEMGNEIEEQNLQLDRINNKVDIADNLIQDQNKQLRGILRK